ncbi:3-oxoacyl-reductase, partial [Jimgerdemannia flammicorona]
ERGIIVNTTSITRNAGQAGQIAYAASKGGVAALTLPMARDLAPYGVRVVAIAPGVFQTPMSSFRRMTPEQVAATHELIAKVMFEFPRRMGQPSEYAKLVVQIVENPMLNGNIIRLDAAVRLGKGRLDYVVKLGKL